MGSSGIRAGASHSDTTKRVNVDYLTSLWAGRGLDETIATTISALRDLPAKAGFAVECARVGGGFSAWRLALQQGATDLAATLRRIQTESGVAVLVIPQEQEGAYGYFGARQWLGSSLTTTHVLDIGGGSLQISGAHSTFGDALGQKIWHRTLCDELRATTSKPCALQPMTDQELTRARTLLAKKLSGIATTLPANVTMTAISRPVSRGVMPAVQHLAGETAATKVLQRSTLTKSIQRITAMTSEETATLFGSTKAHAAYLLSDMLLVEGLLQATNANELHVAELDLTNLPGLLADDRAFLWSDRYDCYLERLPSLGLDAYHSDPASCIMKPKP
jgi:hypothetical protein